MNVENKVLGRIKKMLALGNDAGATEAERETALRMAYNLLAKHNLSMSDLPADQNNEAREELFTTISADKWARDLAAAVAKLFFCSYYFSRAGTAGKDRHYFVGRQSNTVTAMYMAEYLIKSVKREAGKRYKTPTTPQGRSFCVGAVSTIWRRVNQMIAKGTETTAPSTPTAQQAANDAVGTIALGYSGQDVDAVSGSTALTLVKLHASEQEANAAWINANVGDLKEHKDRADNRLRGGAYFDGKDYGKTVSLNQQIGGTVTSRKQLQ